MPYKALTLFLLFLLPLTSLAQFTLTGTVLNGSDKKPIAGASIFFNHTIFGGATNEKGFFHLTNVKNGQYEMIVSAVGYETYVQTILVNNDINLGTIELKQKSIALKEVKIRANFDREKYYQIFKAKFLGHSENAKQCQILNPDVLYIDFDNHRLTVSADEFIEIENKALGYKIRYLLTDFVLDDNEGTLYYNGYVSFENLKGSKSDVKRWEKNRLKIYEGSQMHFLRSIIGNTLDDEGFEVLKLKRTPLIKPFSDSVIRTKLRHYRQLVQKSSKWRDSLFYWADLLQQPKTTEKLIDTPHLTIKDMLKRTDQKIVYGLTNPDCLYVMYTKRKDYYNSMIYHPSDIPKYPITIVTFKSNYLLFDINGGVINPDGALLEGFWGDERIADSLPVDYETDEKDKAPDSAGNQ